MDAQELNSLANAAAAVDAGIAAESAPPPVAGAPEKPASDPVAEAREVIAFCVTMLEPGYPSLVKVYTPDRQERLAAVLAPLMQKYDLTFGGIFGRWSEEINFLIVAFPLLRDTLAAVRADNEARKVADAQAKPSPSGAD